MNKGISIFGDNGIDNRKFHYHKILILINVGIDKILVSKKVYSGGIGYKVLIGYKYYHYRGKKLSIMLPNQWICKRF